MTFLVIVLWKSDDRFFSYRLVTTLTLFAFQRRSSSVLNKFSRKNNFIPYWTMSLGAVRPPARLVTPLIFVFLDKLTDGLQVSAWTGDTLSGCVPVASLATGEQMTSPVGWVRLPRCHWDKNSTWHEEFCSRRSQSMEQSPADLRLYIRSHCRHSGSKTLSVECHDRAHSLRIFNSRWGLNELIITYYYCP